MKTPTAFLVGAALLCGCGKITVDDLPAASASAKSEPASKSAPAPAAGGAAATTPEKVAYTCNVAQQHLCYTMKPPAALLKGMEGGCTGTWSQGESCAKEKIVATCKQEQHEEVRYFYDGVKLDKAETSCTAFGGTFARS